ncbi:nicotinamide mononucleotide transporter [Mucilaginibacter robiniae]|uniref:Nicotinamide riboside transporter PnuC n=1 Tax=Mucilaginibacter robiniae TaxID=2728022 RepID=A0A7L5E2E0_9SPHI|nr:nicotinamide riboside transporter PnuC [Mucilaginibacter robiniae]QJD95784.1 nicotinamide mononucleotide transporter [Mucilaginibacter robiniae]
MQVFHILVDWFHQQSWLELIGVVTGLLCVYLAAINNIWNWPFAIINTAIYVYIFGHAALYADMGQNAYLLIINIYGWYYWSRQPQNAPKVLIKLMSRKQVLAFILIVALITPVLGFALTQLAPLLHYQPAAYPYLDSFCTVCSLVAQIYMARKVLENWLIWIFVDIIYVGVYLSKHLQPTAFMFAVYAIIALLGYFDWRKEYGTQGKA